MNLSEWILKSRDERIAHCDLTTPCCFSEKVGRGHQARGAIFEFHEITNDVGNLKTARIGTNHLCDKDSNNGECCNPLHLYIGTKSENSYDMSEEKRGSGGRACKGRKNTWSTKKQCSKAAGVTHSLRYQSKIDGFVSTPGPLASRIRKQLGLPKGTKGLLNEWAIRLN